MSKGKSGCSGNGSKSMKPMKEFQGSKEKTPARGMPKTGDLRKKGK